jgi:hypothetical protein
MPLYQNVFNANIVYYQHLYQSTTKITSTKNWIRKGKEKKKKRKIIITIEFFLEKKTVQIMRINKHIHPEKCVLFVREHGVHAGPKDYFVVVVVVVVICGSI